MRLSRLSRTALWSALAAAGVALLLLAPPQAFAAPSAPNFNDEPFPVRLVNRARFSELMRPARVAFESDEAPGTVIIDTRARLLYLVQGGGAALRFGIAVGAVGRGWTGTATVGRKSRWPAWYPTDEMKQVAPGLPVWIAPGVGNPLGARALYLYRDGHDTLFRIHGTSEPWTIGTDVSSGCFRMFNEDIIALFDLVPVGAKVIVR